MILVAATALDTPVRMDELRSAALAARGGSDAAVSVVNLITAEQASADGAIAALAQVCAQHQPSLLLLTGDDLGLEIGARLSVRLQAGFVSGCGSFEHAPDGALLFLRPVFGGRAVETLSSATALTIVCIKPKSFDSRLTDAAAQQWTITEIKPAAIDSGVTRVERHDALQQHAVSLEDAAIIVSGGRGVGGVEGFAQLKQLAQALGGALGASRAAVDMGWIPATHQVGMTGKTVAPEVYIAVGISGAMQHLAGISAARRVVAINTDEQAPIFGVADVGVVGDARAMAPALREALFGENPVSSRHGAHKS